MAKFVKGDIVVVPFPHIILYRIGNIKKIKLDQIVDKVVKIIKE